jgi:outer membrane lipoprotein-sorting protein
MLARLLLLIAMASSLNNPIDAALESFHNLSSYRVTIRSSSGGSSQTIRYFFKSPGFVRMEFINPHNGAVLVYNPDTKKARLRPFGFLKALVLTLDPGSGLITSPQGHRVDASDLGSFLGTVKRLADKGKSRVIGKEKVGERDAVLVEVTGTKGITVADGIHRYLLWMDAGTLLPIRTRSFDADGNNVEDVFMDDLEINVELSENLFEL